jgi:hypothetical protein
MDNTPSPEPAAGRGRPKRREREVARAVRDHDGDVVAVVRGRHVTADDVEQARLLVRGMPDYTAAVKLLSPDG